jgi:hypothetical protein
VGFAENAAAIAQSVAARDVREESEFVDERLWQPDLSERADAELKLLTGVVEPLPDDTVRQTLQVSDSIVDFEISGALIGFSRQLRDNPDPAHSFAALRALDRQLDTWERDQHSSEESASLPFGVRIHVKRRFRE